MRKLDRQIKAAAEKWFKKGHYKKFIYSFGSGKRIRPLLMKKICERFDKKFDSLIEIAAAIEILHCASLVLDDIIDLENIRRNKKPFYKKFSLNEGILYGNLFATTSFEIVTENNHSKELRIAFIKTLKEMIEGQLMELEGEIKDAKSYFKYIKKKTGSLFLLSAKIPFLVFNLKDKKILNFAEEFGIAFQIANDLSKGEKEKYTILSYLSRKEAEKLLGGKVRYLDSLNIIGTKQLGF